MWKDVADNYYDPLKLQRIGWDEIYTEYIPLVWNASDDGEYYRLLERFMAAVGDGHTEFISPQTASQRYGLPIYDIFPMGGKYYMLGWFPQFLPGIDYRPEFVAVNGVPFERYLDENFIVAGSTPQWRRYKALNEFVLQGEKGDSLTITLKDREGNVKDCPISYCINYDKIQNHEITYIDYPVVKGRHAAYSFKDKNGADGFMLCLGSFNNIPSITSDLKILEDKIKKADYIVVDLRFNSGGDETIADTLLMSFLDVDTLKTYKSQHRIHSGVRAATAT